MYFLRDSISAGFEHVVRFRERLVAFAPYAVVLALAVAFYPTSALSISSNRVENELVQNGDSSFFRAARTSDIDYESYYASARPADNLRLLEAELADDGAPFTQLAEGKMNRFHAARPDGLGRLNVVVVSSESFGAEFSKLHGSKKDWTPNFDAYAKQGLWFANTYASGTRTVRGLEAITSSFPPIPTVSILRRPGNQGIGSWGKVMNDLGYQSSFLYGGYGYFDDMNTFFAGNGFQVLDRTDIDKVRFENVWGVADEDLFDRAIQHYGEQYKAGKPFFSIIMTTSNHKPFTFRPGLEQAGIKPEGGGRQSGVRYADYALGYFLREAAQQPWFDDTIFVVVADHGARVYGKAEIPLETYEIPLHDLLAEAHRAAAGRHADDADRHRADRARPAGPAVRGAVLRHRRAARAARPRAHRALQPQPRRGDPARQPARGARSRQDPPVADLRPGGEDLPAARGRRGRCRTSASRISRRRPTCSRRTATTDLSSRLRPITTGVSDMGKGMDRKKETKKKPAKSKDEKRAEKKAKKA